MAGLVPAIHVFVPETPRVVDARDEPGMTCECALTQSVTGIH
jgi:hypothetical protein